MIVPKRKIRYPLAIEREYAKMLVAYVQAEIKIIESFIPEMANAIIQNSIRQDGIGDWIGNIVEKIKRKVEKTISPTSIIGKIFGKVDKHVKKENSETIKSIFGAEPKIKENPRDFEMLKTIWISQNTTLIKSVDSQTMDKIRYSLSQKIMAAADKKILMQDLTREIQEIAGVSEKRAALIGADQVGKLNGKLTQYRQMNAGIEWFIWRTMGDNRVRPAHAAKNGVAYRWDSDVEKPGEAVRCRCVAQPLIDENSFKLIPLKNSYTNFEDSAKMSAEGLDLLHNEFAVIQDNGNRNQYTVNFSLMNSKAWHDKFENLSENKNVNESLYKQSAKILSHRSGTEYEDIAMIDARTGKLLVENNSASGNLKHKCGLSHEQHEKLQSSGKKFEILHNHPSSSIPSTADIQGLFNRENAVASTVVCHDGTVYRMEKIKQFADIDNLIKLSYYEVKSLGFPDNLIEFRAVERIIANLEEQNVLRYKRVI